MGTGSARLYLLDSAILTGVFRVVCLASLLTARPLMYHFALASNGGADSPKGKDFAGRWQYPAFRRVFVVMTVVWGVAFVVQAAINAAIIESSRPGPSTPRRLGASLPARSARRPDHWIRRAPLGRRRNDPPVPAGADREKMSRCD